jgi:hypothetical protein
MNYYHVFLGTKHIDLVKAYTSEHAIQIIEIIFGPAKKYSAIHNYRAVRA